METKKNKGMNIGLWVVQGLLGAMFVLAGSTKAVQPIEVLVESLPWVTSISPALVKFIGVSELFGGLGLLIPSIFRFKPFLTVWAAYGLALIMVLAAIFHASRSEFSAIGINVIIAALFLFIAWGRSKKAPIFPKE